MPSRRQYSPLHGPLMGMALNVASYLAGWSFRPELGPCVGEQQQKWELLCQLSCDRSAISRHPASKMDPEASATWAISM